jgi:hypothetical protein
MRLLFAVGDAEAAVLLAGALIDGWFREMVLVTADEFSQRDALLRAAEATLGSERYAAARARGAAMPYEQVVGYALGELDRVFPSR